MIPTQLYASLTAAPMSTVPLAVPSAPAEADKAGMTSQLEEVQTKISSLEDQLHGLEIQHDGYLRRASDLTSDMNSLYDRVQPLSKKEDRAIMAANISRYSGKASAMLLGVGPLLALTVSRAMGGAFFLVDAAVLGASMLTTEWSRRTRRDLTPQVENLVNEWKCDKRELDRLQALHSGDSSRMSSLQSQINTERGKEQVLSVALSVNSTAEPPRPEHAVRQEDEAIIIGNLRIPRRVMEG